MSLVCRYLVINQSIEKKENFELALLRDEKFWDLECMNQMSLHSPNQNTEKLHLVDTRPNGSFLRSASTPFEFVLNISNLWLIKKIEANF